MDGPEGGEAARVAALLLVRLDGAEVEARLARCIGGRESLLDQIVRARVEMLAQLVVQVALEPRAADEGVEDVPQTAQHVTPGRDDA